MSDLISRQAAIDALAKHMRDMAVMDSFDADTSVDGWKPLAENVLKSVPSAQPEWIPCSERLPEEYGDYLITWTTSRRKRPFIAICEGVPYSNEFEWQLEDYIYAYPNVKVIAWMPLPEPYKKEG